VIESYKVNSETSEVSVVYKGKDYTVPPNNQNGVLTPVLEEDCESVVTGIITGLEVAKLNAEADANYDANQYQRDRAKDYPPIEEQLDYIYHNGVEAWKTDMILPVKTKYPKENT